MNSAGVIVSEEVREGLLRLHGGRQTAVFEALKPPYSTSTCYRAITGKAVGEDVKSWFHSRFFALTTRVYSDEELDEALEAARAHLEARRGRRVYQSDFRREVVMFLKEAEGE